MFFQSLGDVLGLDFSTYPNLNSWFERMKKEVKNYDKADGNGVEGFRKFVENILLGAKHDKDSAEK